MPPVAESTAESSKLSLPCSTQGGGTKNTLSNKPNPMMEIRMNILNKFLNWSSNYIFISKVDRPNFHKETSKAIFLLEHLWDDDLNWALPHFYLRRVRSLLHNSGTELEIVSNLYLAWIAIAVQIDDFKDREIDAWWMYRLDATAQHIFEKIIPILTINNQMQFSHFLPIMHKTCHERINFDLDKYL
jgi:hypothetical protein